MNEQGLFDERTLLDRKREIQDWLGVFLSGHF